MRHRYPRRRSFHRVLRIARRRGQRPSGAGFRPRAGERHQVIAARRPCRGHELLAAWRGFLPVAARTDSGWIDAVIVLFDLDGTLFDHAGADHEAALALRAVLAPKLPEKAFLTEWRMAEIRHYSRYLAGEISFAEQRRARVRAVAGERLSDAEADLAFNFYFSAYRNAWRLFEDVRPCLAALSGLRLGLVTNGDGAVQRRKIEALGLAEFFDAVVISGEVGLAKPDPRIFALACARLGAEPASALFIGDDRRLDAEAASAAGLRGLWLDRLGADAPDPIRVASLVEIPALCAAAG
ncbi:hypothetical protein CCR94_12695 [Rhodoblastus sphagnicola]|uniref:Haloacid dehalogenase n=1 Tax=Rhodoblastus sphagnicola TaxID=333368 RepID=A0A2S6N6U0_9HYPH|nr:hypothetical protein CCR94_12695 [Rhodoblastus sphagnicola]